MRKMNSVEPTAVGMVIASSLDLENAPEADELDAEAEEAEAAGFTGVDGRGVDEDVESESGG